jgi:hypothetical protein
MMHKHSEQQNDRKWNSDQPKQYAFSKRHGSLHFMLEKQRARVPSVPCRFRRKPLTAQHGSAGTARFVGRYAAAKADFYRPSRSPRTSRCRKTCHAFSLRYRRATCLRDGKRKMSSKSSHLLGRWHDRNGRSLET